MSGGSYEYAFHNVERFAEALERGVNFDNRPTDEPNCPARLGFAAHLRKVAAAMKAIEWEDSGDCSPPEAADAIREAIGPTGALRDEAVRQLRDLAAHPDREAAHSGADAVLCELLAALGFQDVVDAFNDNEKWYA